MSESQSFIDRFFVGIAMPDTAHARFQRWLDQSDPEEDDDTDIDGPQSREAQRLANLDRLIRNEGAKRARRGESR